MGWEFQGDNLVYKAPAEVAGYTWKPIVQNENGTNPEGVWVQNEDFDPGSLINGRTDKYGRVDNSLKADATEAEKRAYALAYQGANPNSEALENNSVGNTHEIIRSTGWWNVDPAIQAREEAKYANHGGILGSGGGFFGLKPSEWIAPAAIIGGGLATAALAPAAAAAAPAWDAAFAYGGGALPELAGGTAATFAPSAVESLSSSVNNLANLGETVNIPTTQAFTNAPLYTSGVSDALGYVPSSVVDTLAGGGGALPGVAVGAPLATEFGMTGALPAVGVAEGGIGLSSALPAGNILGSGFGAGGAIGAGYALGANGLPATNLFGSLIPSSSIGFGDIPSTVTSATTLSDIKDTLKDVNQARQGLSTASNIAKLLGAVTAGTAAAKVPTSTTSGLNLNQLASLLAPKTQTNDFIGQYKMNQNPFLFTPQGQTVASPGMYDVSGSNMANALRKA
jgi:hypothetical protein